MRLALLSACVGIATTAALRPPEDWRAKLKLPEGGAVRTFVAGTVDELILNEAGEVEAYEVKWADGLSNQFHTSLIRPHMEGTPLG